MKAGNLVFIQGSFTRVGVKSFSYEMRLYETDSMTHCASQKTVEVCFDTEKRASAQFPDDIHKKLVAMVSI
jgi:acyl-CoA thioesterase FadM